MSQETESQKGAKFIKWLWLHRDVQKDFHVHVLTDTNNDQTLPIPHLTKLESEDLFRYLEGNKLVFLKCHVDADPAHNVLEGNVYALNKVEHYNWDKTIKELKKADWRRSSWWIKLKESPIYIISVLVAGFLGAWGEHILNDVYDIRGKGKAEATATDTTTQKTTMDAKKEEPKK